jgi:hypothetical protein
LITILTPKIAFLAVRACRAILAFISLYLVQSHLINAYSPSVNASVQVALKLLGIQGLFTTGFALIILSHPIDYKEFLLESAHVFWLSFVSKLVGLLSLALLISIAFHSSLDISLGSIYWPLIAFLLLGLLGGEGQAFAYASRAAYAYESKILISQIISLLLLGFAFYMNLSPWLISIVVFAAFAFPRYLVDALYCVKQIPPFPRRLALPWNSGSKRLLIKATSSSALSVIAFLNWSIDVIILANIGTAAAVNKLSVFTLAFSAPAIMIGFASPMLQLRWSNSKNLVKACKDICFLGLVCAIGILGILAIFSFGSRAIPLLFPVHVQPGFDGLFVSIAFLSFLSCFSTLIGVLMNSYSMIGRQVLIVGLIITPMNIFMSLKMFPILGAAGIVLATISAQAITILLNILLLWRLWKAQSIRVTKTL